MDIQCVIAAGGRGMRLGRLTLRRPKPMVPVCGVPFLARLMTRLAAAGVRRFVLLTGYGAADIAGFFGDGRAFGYAIQYSHEESPLGTGGALRRARNMLDDDFLFVNADDYPKIDYQIFVEKFQHGHKLAQVAVCRAADGRLEIDRGTAQVREFGDSGTFLDCGTKAFSRQVVEFLPDQPINLESALWPVLIERGDLIAFELAERPYAIDTPAALAEFEDWLHRRQLTDPGAFGTRRR